MLIVILLDLAVPDLPDVIGLCGSTGLSLFCYVVPGQYRGLNYYQY